MGIVSQRYGLRLVERERFFLSLMVWLSGWISLLSAGVASFVQLDWHFRFWLDQVGQPWLAVNMAC